MRLGRAGLSALMGITLLAALPMSAAATSGSSSSVDHVFSYTQTSTLNYNATKCVGGQWPGFQAISLTTFKTTWHRTSTFDHLVKATYTIGSQGFQCNGVVNLQTTGTKTVHPVDNGTLSLTLNYRPTVLNAAEVTTVGAWVEGTVTNSHIAETGTACTWTYLSGIFIDCP